jgi:hypothetical protein
VKIREKNYLSRFITNILVGACGVPHFCTEEITSLTPNQRKTPSPSGLGFFVLNAFKGFEGFLAVQASMQGLAGGGTKGRDALRLGAFASWAVQGNAEAQ